MGYNIANLTLPVTPVREIDIVLPDTFIFLTATFVAAVGAVTMVHSTWYGVIGSYDRVNVFVSELEYAPATVSITRFPMVQGL